MKRKIYQAPELNSYEETGECQLLVGTTIPVDPGEEGSQSQAESKPTDFEDTDKALRSFEPDFEDTDKALRSFEHNPLDYLPSAFQDIWGEE